MHDPKISEIFYYFQADTDLKNGRTVGRKIGVVQEIIIKKALLANQKIRDCLIYEPRVRGRSGATHKVEFVLFYPIVVANIPKRHRFRVLDPSVEISVEKIDLELQKARVSVLTGDGHERKLLAVDQAFPVTVVRQGHPSVLFVKLVSVSENTCRVSLLDSFTPLASLESKRVGAQRFSGSDNLGSGIQTIEKAKQTSLVAIDFDLQFNQQMLAFSDASEARRFRSFALLGNGVHWTDHDLSVLQTYVDYTFQVKDDAIIRYCDFVRLLSQQNNQPFLKFFLSYFNGMTKTPTDSFGVTMDDFVLLRPSTASCDQPRLNDLVYLQIPDYEVANI